MPWKAGAITSYWATRRFSPTAQCAARSTTAAARLTPAAGNDSPAGDVTLTVDTATMRPLSLSYDYDGEQVLVTVLEVAPLAGHVRRFDPKNYEGYEFIDFR